MQDFGINLICVEDGIDSSKDAGKLMISVLSAVAEIERENIRVQTMEGRMQKAREGKWNQKIKDYVKDKYGVNVQTSYIAQVKRMCGLDMGENYNKSKKENPEVKQCPQEKVEYIMDALRHFKLIW